MRKLHLQTFVLCLLAVDFGFSIVLMCPVVMLDFVYSNPGGRAGFVDDKWVSHYDIYRFRRYQPWEQEVPIDWDKDNRTTLAITRDYMDGNCSHYTHDPHIPGDPGDYQKDVAGHPNSSGFNAKVKKMLDILLAAVTMMYLSDPLILLSMWWKQIRMGLIILYVVIRLIPPCLVSYIWYEFTQSLLCGVAIMYYLPIEYYVRVFALCLWFYEIFKMLVLALFCIEQGLARKRKDYGFRRRRTEQQLKAQSNTTKFDAEKAAHKDNKIMKKIQGGGNKEEIITSKAIAREILELGSTTEGESAFEERLEVDIRRSSVVDEERRKSWIEHERRHSFTNRDSFVKAKKSIRDSVAGSEDDGPRRKSFKVTFND